MGTDISAFVEYDLCDGTPFSASDRISSLTCGGFDLPRDSPVFAALAGVRGDSPKPVVAPRGIPPHLSAHASHDYYQFIVEDADGPLPYLCDDRYVLRSEAEARVADGDAHYPPDSPDPPRLVSEFAFCAGWVSAQEFSRVLELARIEEENPVQFEVLGQIVSTLAARIGVDRVRLVFWFY